MFVNDSFCDHFTLSLNNRNETTAASGDSAKTFAPPGSGQHSQLPSRVRREVRPRLHYLAATRDLHRPLLIQNIRTSCDHLQREIPFRLQQTEKSLIVVLTHQALSRPARNVGAVFLKKNTFCSLLYEFIECKT